MSTDTKAEAWAKLDLGTVEGRAGPGEPNPSAELHVVTPEEAE